MQAAGVGVVVEGHLEAGPILAGRDGAIGHGRGVTVRGLQGPGGRRPRGRVASGGRAGPPAQKVLSDAARLLDPATGLDAPGDLLVADGRIAALGTVSRPRDAEVAVPYRGYWFYIPRGDVNSRSVLAVLEILFSLQESDERSTGPVLTLPAGR